MPDGILLTSWWYFERQENLLKRMKLLRDDLCKYETPLVLQFVFTAALGSTCKMPSLSSTKT